MKIPYIFHYHSSPEMINYKRPNWSTIRFPKAQGTKHLKFKNAELSSQIANFKPFYIEFLEFSNKSNFVFQCEVTSPQHFLFILIEGNSVNLYTAEGLFVAYVKKGHLAMTYHNGGTFQVRMKRGNYTALCLTMESAWLDESTVTLPVILEYLSTIAKSPPNYTMLPYCTITKDIETLLKGIHSQLSNGIFYINNFLSLQVFQILKKYEPLAKEKQSGIQYQVRSFIHEHFADPNLNSQSIARHFGKVERNLKEQFKTEFNISLHDYYSHLRVSRAKHLMKLHNLGPLDVYLKVGYKEPNTLRYQLKKFSP